MKIICALLLFCSLGFSSEKLRIYADTNPDQWVRATSEFEEIVPLLNSVGIRFERWAAKFALPVNFEPDSVIAAYAQDVERLKSEGYPTVDVIRMFPDNPKKIDIRKKFLNEHTHTEDEVRFFVEGSGLFYIHVQDHVYIVLCEQGDLISIPAYYAHWFDMGDAPFFTAIRFFINPDGWIADFTGKQISQQFPKFGE